MLAVSFKIKFMFELAILDIVFNMETSNIKQNDHLQQKNESRRCRLKTNFFNLS